MMKKYFISFLVFLFLLSCSKQEEISTAPVSKEDSFVIFQEAIDAMNSNDLNYAAKKFQEAELILPNIEYASRASLLASYCYYSISFYEASQDNLDRFIAKYPADKNIAYAYYLSAIISYEQILDEKKDIKPLLQTREKIQKFVEKFPNTEYTLDLKFKLGLVRNQLAAKEIYVARYYMETQKWIPAINRLKIVVAEFDDTIYIEEALHRLVEVYYKIGLENEAKKTASILGYNYNSSIWYEKSYSILNKDYKIKKKRNKKKDKDDGLIKRTIKKILS